MCSFWLVEALTRAGRTDPARLEDARLLFEQMLGYANHLGLFAEQTGNSGEALGNYPQAFTHLALISAAFNLDRALGRGESARRPGPREAATVLGEAVAAGRTAFQRESVNQGELILHVELRSHPTDDEWLLTDHFAPPVVVRVDRIVRSKAINRLRCRQTNGASLSVHPFQKTICVAIACPSMILKMI